MRSKKKNQKIRFSTKKKSNIKKAHFRSNKRIRRFTQKAGAAEQPAAETPTGPPAQPPAEQPPPAVQPAGAEQPPAEVAQPGRAARILSSAGSYLGRKGEETSNFFHDSIRGTAKAYDKHVRYNFKDKEYDECSFVKTLDNTERSLFRTETLKERVIRQLTNHEMFKKEDKYFKSLLGKNLNAFCFNNKETADDMEYSRFCKRVTKCFKKPNKLDDVLFKLIDAKSTERMHYRLPKASRRKIEEQFKNEKPKEYNEKVKNPGNKNEEEAFNLLYLQDENIKTFAKFLKNVIIKTFLDYKDSNGKAPEGTYTGTIAVEPYFDDLFKKILKKTDGKGDDAEGEAADGGVEGGEEAPEGEAGEAGGEGEDAEGGSDGGSQSGEAAPEGGTSTSGQSGGAGGVSLADVKKKAGEKSYTAAELKQIKEEDLYEGIKSCEKKDLIRSDYEKKAGDDDDDMGDEFKDDADDNIDSVGKAMETPKLLYIVMGCLIVVGIIESGALDAPICLTHTII